MATNSFTRRLNELDIDAQELDEHNKNFAESLYGQKLARDAVNNQLSPRSCQQESAEAEKKLSQARSKIYGNGR